LDTILVITDFTLSAYNAGKFAIALAQSMEARVVLFNAFPDFTENNRPETARFLNNEAKKVSQAALIAELESINHSMYKHVSFANRKGPVVSAILKAATTSKANLIVAASGQKENSGMKMFGGILAELLADARVPVMLIPFGSQPGTITRMAILDESHLENKIRNEHRLLIKKLINVFDPRLYIVTVVNIRNEEIDKVELSEPLKNLSLEGAQAVYLSKNNMPEALNRFAGNTNINLLTILRQSPTFLQRTFDQLLTSALIFDMAIPLLMIPLN
jgi:nucleotide-binding universal stress UspA family protein